MVMGMASPLISAILLVAVAVSIVPPASSSRVGPPAPLEASEFKRPSFVLPPPGRIGQIIPEIGVCLESIVKVEGCVADLRASSRTSHVNVTRDCCDAVVSLGAECFAAVFTTFPFNNPLFPPLLKEFCNVVFSRTGRHHNKISLPPTPAPSPYA